VPVLGGLSDDLMPRSDDPHTVGRRARARRRRRRNRWIIGAGVAGAVLVVAGAVALADDSGNGAASVRTTTTTRATRATTTTTDAAGAGAAGGAGGAASATTAPTTPPATAAPDPNDSSPVVDGSPPAQPPVTASQDQGSCQYSDGDLLVAGTLTNPGSLLVTAWVDVTWRDANGSIGSSSDQQNVPPGGTARWSAQDLDQGAAPVGPVVCDVVVS
jgi:hypothetical protein